MLFHYHPVERRAQFITIAAGGNHAATEYADLLPGVVHGDFGFFQRLARLQQILLGGNLVLPQLLLALVGGARQGQAPLRRSLFATLIGDLLTGDHRQQLALLHPLPEIDRHRLDYPWHPRYDVGGAVFVQAHFAGERQTEADALRPRFGQLNARRRDLLGTQRQMPLFTFGCNAFFVVVRMLRRFIGVGLDGPVARPHRANTNAQRQRCHRDNDQFFIHGNSSAPCHRAVI